MVRDLLGRVSRPTESTLRARRVRPATGMSPFRLCSRLASAVAALREAIPGAADRHEEARSPGIRLDLGAEAGHEIVDRAIGAEVIGAPDAIEDALAGQEHALVLEEEAEELHL